MTVLMFQPRFEAPILAGTKKQTIRPPRKRPLMIGESLSLRRWAGTAYRSKQTVIKETSVAAVFEIFLCKDGYAIGKSELEIMPDKLDVFARGDGFESWNAMRSYWITGDHHYGFPFTGVLIQWE